MDSERDTRPIGWHESQVAGRGWSHQVVRQRCWLYSALRVAVCLGLGTVVLLASLSAAEEGSVSGPIETSGPQAASDSNPPGPAAVGLPAASPAEGAQRAGASADAPPAAVVAPLAEAVESPGEVEAKKATVFPPTPAQQIQNQRTQLAADIEQLSEDIRQQQINDPSHPMLQLVGYLRFLDSILAQQQIVADHEREVAADLSKLELELESWELAGIESHDAYSFLGLEQLRDQKDDTQLHLDLAQSEADSTRSFLESIRQQYIANERQRRQLKDQLERLRNAGEAAQLQQQLRLLELRRRIGEELIRLRGHELAVNERERNLTQRRVEWLNRLIPAVGATVIFTQTDLNQFLADLEKQQLMLNQQLTRLQQSLREIDAMPAGESPEDPSVQDSMQVVRRALHRGIAQTNESLAEVMVLRYIWKARFRVLNDLATPEELSSLKVETDRFLERVRSTEMVLNAHQQETRLEMDALTRQTSSSMPAELQTLKQKTLTDWFRLAGARQRLLRTSGRVLSRFATELETRLDALHGGKRWAQIFAKAQTAWSYELLVVDDRPITVGKLFAGLGLLGTGLFVARFLSRTVGTRMLPGIGLHQGASQAVQTISFYALVCLFGLFTLELLNIPITVLTFFGGAAAIAIGFGSQNILNNFISGLILLGEQPIRMGDLIEVEGQHGTVEHIGARSTRVRTGRNYEIIIPNSKFLESNVKNLTLSSNEVRAVVQVGVAYGSDIGLVMRLLKEVTARQSFVLKRPEPIVLFTDFGETALIFQVHFWIHIRTQMDGLQAESAVRLHIERALRDADLNMQAPPKPLRALVAPAPDAAVDRRAA